MLEYATRLYDLGIITIPVNLPYKVPPKGFEWRVFAESKPDKAAFVAKWTELYRPGMAIAVPCGGIEMFEADVKNDPKGDIHTRLLAAMKAQLPEALYNSLYIQKSPSGGIHFWYRVPQEEMQGNTKLAMLKYSDAQRFEFGLAENQPGIETLIETRGLGGYALIAPSTGYEVIQGAIGSLPMLTAEERDFIWMIGRSFNEYEPEAEVYKAGAHAPTPNGKRPGDVYNEQLGADGLLNLVESYGFRPLRRIGDSVFLGRPGAKHANKHDAKVNLRFNCFVNFSSSVPDFIPTKGYSAYYVYAYLAHHGNFAEATKALAAKGFEHPDSRQEYQQRQNHVAPAQQVEDVSWADVQHETAVERLSHLRFSLADRPKMKYTFFVKSGDKNIGVGFPGAIVAVYGQAKSRKTTVLGAMVAAALGGRKVLNFSFEQNHRILWIDTEQGDLYFWETIRRVYVQARVKTDDRENMYAYKFVDQSFSERIQNTERLIEEIQPTVIIIDGIVDFVRNFNDETESLEIMNRLRKWAATGAMIFPVLHQNPSGKGGDAKARGHLGTMLTNKCDSAISVFPIGDDKSRVLIKHAFSRGPQFNSFELTAGKWGVLHSGGGADYDFSIGEPPENPDEIVMGGVPDDVDSEKAPTFDDIPF